MRLRKKIEHFINLEVLSSLLLLLCLFLALIISNTHLLNEYQALIKLPIGITIGHFSFDKPLIKWVNDGLMALFFLLLTIEAKYHCLEGEFRSKSSLALPSIAALGGAIVPPVIYYLFTSDNPSYLKGWAIPIATDTAFVLGILAFFPTKISLSGRLFVIALSIIDDLIAVLVIAIFYTASLQLLPMVIILICIVILLFFHYLKVSNLFFYLLIGAAIWVAFVEAGVHGTIAGVLLGIFIPLQSKEGDRNYSPLKRLESFLHPFVAFIILPIFVFLNGGVSFNELSLNDIFSPISLGIITGLLIGKPLGIILFSYVAIRLWSVKLPNNISWQAYYGISLLCGIGFTFSIFIGSLSFNEVNLINQMKLGVILGSIFSALGGILVFRYLPRLNTR